MPETKYLTYSSPITTGDVWTAQVAQGSVASPQAAKVPPGVSKLKQIMYSFGDNTPTGAITAHNYALRVQGAGIKDVDSQEFVLQGETVFFDTAGMSGGPGPHLKKDVNVDVVAESELDIAVMATLGVLGGAPEPTITLGFE